MEAIMYPGPSSTPKRSVTVAGNVRTPEPAPQSPNPAKSHSDVRRFQTDPALLFAEFAPLVHRLIRQYGQDPELRQDLEGEIYCRFCALLEAYDPERGVPLRPYLVRQLTASIYTYARYHWRLQKREIAWEPRENAPEPVA